MDKNISFTLKIWRQNGPKEKGHFDTFQMKDIPGDTPGRYFVPGNAGYLERAVG